MMRPYWIKTDHPLSSGVGITAHSEEDAKFLFRLAWPAGRQIVEISPVRDMRDIDQNHVAPNMESWLRRGIWFPRGYSHLTTC
jgi:hypothetical protein